MHRQAVVAGTIVVALYVDELEGAGVLRWPLLGAAILIEFGLLTMYFGCSHPRFGSGASTFRLVSS